MAEQETEPMHSEIPSTAVAIDVAFLFTFQ